MGTIAIVNVNLFFIFLAVYSFVITHEYAHVFAAMKRNVKCGEINIFPFGGADFINTS